MQATPCFMSGGMFHLDSAATAGGGGGGPGLHGVGAGPGVTRPIGPPAAANGGSSSSTGGILVRKDYQQQPPPAPSNKPQPSSTSKALVPAGAGASGGAFFRNPLLCAMCNNTYQNPCLLACYHSFCASCIKGRLGKDGKLPCPLCG